MTGSPNRLNLPSLDRQARMISSVTAALLLSIATSGRAQTAPPPSTPPDSDQPTVLNAFVVNGYQQSLQASLNAKRASNDELDVITAEDVGKFPDTNVAESLSHIPGITVDRLFGEGEKVSILGTDPNLNLTFLNGEPIASCDWFVLDQPGRSFDYALLSPDVIGQVEVYKTPEARLDEGSIGGTVIVHTRDPLSIAPNTVAGSLGYLYNDRAEKGDLNASLLYGWHNQAKTFGIIVGAQDFVERIDRQGLENFGETPGNDALSNYTPTNPADPTYLANPNAIVLGSLNSALFTQKRERLGGNLGVTLKPSDRFKLEINGLLLREKFNNANQSFYINPNATNNGGASFLADQFPNETIDSLSVSNGYVNSAHFVNGYAEYDAAFRTAIVHDSEIDAKATFSGDNWNASIHTGGSTAKGGTQDEDFAILQNQLGYSYTNFLGNHPSFTFDNPAAARNPANWVLGDTTNDPNNPSFEDKIPFADKFTYIQGDGDISLKSWLDKVLFGVKYVDHTTSHGDTSGPLQITASTTSLGPTLTPGNFLSGFDVSSDMKSHLLVSEGSIFSLFDTPGAVGAQAPNYAQIWTLDEEISAAYLQGNFSFGQFSGNAGVRAIQTHDNSMGFTIDPTGAVSPANVTHKYNNFLPSVNLAYNAAPDLILRAAGSQVIARPNQSDMTSFLSVSNSPNIGQGGNPHLNPYKANDFDVSAEWYFAKNSIIEAHLFYKKIDSYISQATDAEVQFNGVTQQAQTYLITRPFNASNASSKGVLLAFQQTFSNGLGILTNYTYDDAVGHDQQGNSFPLIYSSKHEVNVSPFYENKTFSARLTYQWRSRYASPAYFGAGVFTKPYTELDASFGYNLTKNMKLTLDVLNILDYEDYQYYQVGSVQTMGYTYREGRRIQTAVHFTF